MIWCLSEPDCLCSWALVSKCFPELGSDCTAIVVCENCPSQLLCLELVDGISITSFTRQFHWIEMSIVVGWCPCFVFGAVHIHILVYTLAILTEGCHWFSQSKDKLQIRLWPHLLQFLWFIFHHLVWYHNLLTSSLNKSFVATVCVQSSAYPH